MGITELIFELLALKAKIKGVFNQKKNYNLSTNDWAFVPYISVIATEKEL